MSAKPFTAKQATVMVALAVRDTRAWISEPSDLAEATGLTERGVLFVLYHLSDAGHVYYDDLGWHVT